MRRRNALKKVADLLAVVIWVDLDERGIGAGDGALGAPDGEIDAVAYEIGGSVALASDDAAGMPAAGGKHK